MIPKKGLLGPIFYKTRNFSRLRRLSFLFMGNMSPYYFKTIFTLCLKCMPIFIKIGGAVSEKNWYNRQTFVFLYIGLGGRTWMLYLDFQSNFGSLNDMFIGSDLCKTLDCLSQWRIQTVTWPSLALEKTFICLFLMLLTRIKALSCFMTCTSWEPPKVLNIGFLMSQCWNQAYLILRCKT